MLTLPIKKKWFDMEKARIKLEDYREIKPYWTKRFVGEDFNRNSIIKGLSNGNVAIFKTIILRNGYRKNSPQIQCMCKIRIGQGKPEWGAEKRKRILYFRNIRSGGVNKYIWRKKQEK